MTSSPQKVHEFHSATSLKPLLGFWRKRVAPACNYMAEMLKTFEAQMAQIPALSGDIEDSRVLEQHSQLVNPLMAVVFPSSTWESEIAGAVTPLENRPFFYTPNFKRILMNEEGLLRGTFKQPEQDVDRFRRLRAFWFILDKIYGIGQGRSTPVIKTVSDPSTGVDRFYRILPDWQFLEVETQGEPQPLSPEDRLRILDNIDNPDMLARLIAPQQFTFRGFIVIRAVDVTESEVFLDLEKDLIDQASIFCSAGMKRLQGRLQTLLGRPELRAGMGALQGDQVWVISDEEHSEVNCIFKNSKHIPLSELKGSIWLRAVAKGQMIVIPDLSQENELCRSEREVLNAGMRSFLIAPLFYQGNIIGTFYIMSPKPNDFTAMDTMLIQPIVPLFSVALKRGMDDIHNEVQAIIKEKCTALHSSVEWRFTRAAFSHLERLHQGKPSELEPIVFKNVIPLFGQADIRGSSEARSKSIQADLTEQLKLAEDVMRWVGQVKSWPLIQQYQHRIQNRIDGLAKGMQSGAEAEIGNFLRQEVEPTFEELMRLGPRVVQAIEKYHRATDPVRGIVYKQRKAYESSVALLNDRLSAYLDHEEAEAQREFPHYFEKHKTDGVDYVIYLGASMREDGHFNSFHLQNLVLWQLLLACGMAWHTENVKAQMSVPLETCHLILYNIAPISIRFRYDEKRFDVDGAYDVRQEIIKSRLDKAMVKGGKERLTQPGRISIVYSQSQEAEVMHRHIKYLQAKNYLLRDIESVELEDLPSVRGLKALRIGVNLEAQALAQRVERVALG
ncbi:MAG: GAF domain-containing protein [Desulfobacteraceae bacterium]|nr:MAG: GAF domain-containing protein [Desulfobacteraceae bacterium]